MVIRPCHDSKLSAKSTVPRPICRRNDSTSGTLSVGGATLAVRAGTKSRSCERVVEKFAAAQKEAAGR